MLTWLRLWDLGVGPQVTGRAGYHPNLPSRPREPRRASPRKQSQACLHRVLRRTWQILTELLLCSQGTCREQSKCRSPRPSLWWERLNQLMRGRPASCFTQRSCRPDYSSELPCFSLEEGVDHSANCRVKEKEKCEAFLLKGKERHYPSAVAMALGKQRGQAFHHQSLEWNTAARQDKRHRGFSPRVGGGREGSLWKVTGAGTVRTGRGQNY